MAALNMRRACALLAVAGVMAAAGCGGGSGGAGNQAGGTANATSAGEIGPVAWLQASARADLDVFNTDLVPLTTVSLAIQAPRLGYWFRYSFDKNLASVTHSFRSNDQGIDFGIQFLGFPQRATGSYTDTLSVQLCYDEACTREVAGSPFRLPLRLDVGYFARAEAGVEPLAPVQTSVLSHDVVAAAYSSALDAVVTVSARPDPALRVHELTSGNTRTVRLLTTPTSLSLAADGLQAAVGHDAAVSLVDLHVGAGAPVRRLDVPMPVGRVLLAGTRVVAFGADVFNRNSIYWIDTDTGTAAATSPAGIPGVGQAAVHPAGDRIYARDSGLSPADVYRMDLTGDPAVATAVDSRYHGDFSICGGLAIAPDGGRLYTGCGVVFRLDPKLENDMVYAGQMALSPADPLVPQRYGAPSLSVAPDGASIALLEENQFACDPRIERLNDCHTRLAGYDATTLARLRLRGLAPYQRGTDSLKQWGRHVMHRNDGSVLIVAEVRTRDEATPTWLLHRVDR